MKVNNINELIGNTPHLRINRLFPAEYEVWVKLEKNNPGGSIKDRIALSMIEDAEQKGILVSGGVIIEPTSGNTGIGLAMVGAVKGYRAILVMPESMSVERRTILRLFGAELVLTPREKGMSGAIEVAEQLVSDTPNAWMPAQFKNPANPKVHREATAKEIIADFPEGFDYLITGVGTGGHITGVSRILKEWFPKMKTFAVEPELSPVLSGGRHSPHPIQGIGAGFVPEVLDRNLLDGIITVSQDEAFAFARKAAHDEGLFAGISTGASLAAISRKLPDIPLGSKILTFNYDTGERYLSISGLFD